MVMKNFVFDIESLRKEFPACQKEMNGVPDAFLDAPAGSQVPQRVAQRIYDYLIYHNANEMGYFDLAMEAVEVEEEARSAVADFLGCEASEVGFSCSSTQNSFNLAHAYAKKLKPGDELIVTDIDHRCNRASWISLQEIYSVVVKVVRVDRETQQIDMEDLKAKLSPKTKVAAFNWASNALGTISDVKTMCAMAHKVGAITIVDAVHYAAHFPIDVKEIDTDVLLCSAYKWFGPHVGVIYMKKKLLEEVDFYNVQTEDLIGPRKFHMGTPQYELLAGVSEAVEFIASVGERYAECFEPKLKGLSGRRRNVVAGMLAIDEYEAPLAKKLREGLRKIPGVTVFGPAEGEPRTSTIVFTMKGKKPAEICKVLGDKGIHSWDGDFYAVELVNDVLGLKDAGGLVRFGLAPYNTEGDIDRTLQTIRDIVS